MSTFIERWHPKGITPQFWVNYRPTKTKKIQKPGSKLGGSYIPLTQNLSGVSDSSLRSWFFLTFKRKSIHPVMHSRYRSRLQNNDAPMLSNQTSHLCNEDLRKGPHSPPDCSGDVGLLGRAWHKSPWILASRNRVEESPPRTRVATNLSWFFRIVIARWNDSRYHIDLYMIYSHSQWNRYSVCWCCLLNTTVAHQWLKSYDSKSDEIHLLPLQELNHTEGKSCCVPRWQLWYNSCTISPLVVSKPDPNLDHEKSS